MLVTSAQSSNKKSQEGNKGRTGPRMWQTWGLSRLRHSSRETRKTKTTYSSVMDGDSIQDSSPYLVCLPTVSIEPHKTQWYGVQAQQALAYVNKHITKAAQCRSWLVSCHPASRPRQHNITSPAALVTSSAVRRISQCTTPPRYLRVVVSRAHDKSALPLAVKAVLRLGPAHAPVALVRPYLACAPVALSPLRL